MVAISACHRAEIVAEWNIKKISNKSKCALVMKVIVLKSCTIKKIV